MDPIGRKSDVLDCQWHAMLHSHGLLTPCFIPTEEIRQLRCFYRLRDDHLTIGASHIQHMQKALDLMNVRLHTVISQIHGVSGLRVIKAIRGRTIVGQIFREAVMSLAKSKYLALGAAYRRIKARRGAAIAMTAIARKLAELYYRLMTKGLDYVEQGIETYEARHKEQTLRSLKKTAGKLGFSLTPANP